MTVKSTTTHTRVCDRCGKQEVEPQPEAGWAKIGGSVGDGRLSLIPGAASGWSADLCPGCAQLFLKWWSKPSAEVVTLKPSA